MPSDRAQYLDANVLLAYVSNEEGRVDIVEQVLIEGAEGKYSLLTSTLSIVEVAYAVDEIGNFAAATEGTINELWTPSSPIQLIEPSVAVMRRARDLMREAKRFGRSVKPADAIHLASAVATAGVHTILTYEADNTRGYWAELTGIAVEEPEVAQQRLPLGGPCQGP